MQQMYRRTPMPKCDFNKVAKQLHRNHTLAWVFSCKFAAYYRKTFLYDHLWRAASELCSSTGVFKPLSNFYDGTF